MAKRLTKQQMLARLTKKPLVLNFDFIDTQPYKSLLSISVGTGVHADIYCVCFRIYVGLELYKLFEEEGEMQKALNIALIHMENTLSFYHKHGKVMFGPNQADWVNRALNIVTEVQKLVSVKELTDAYKRVEVRLSSTGLYK